ncbi:hypothetical protein AVEN_143757-1 [Araneus ventricosus]|uniref:Uncharacterized protein n=1 Tax=Araneus ventricosus TaxID=182803 RepID=A0A4Y2AQH0_ARAVE|nr:hypothetical protein AVEN_143757-1 [Araneus ventricosus]
MVRNFPNFQRYLKREEIKGLSKELNIKQRKIKNAAPFLDEDDIFRAGGRLEKTRLTQDEKHPKLLPAQHRLTKLIKESFYKRHLHVGPQTLFRLVTQELGDWRMKFDSEK